MNFMGIQTQWLDVRNFVKLMLRMRCWGRLGLDNVILPKCKTTNPEYYTRFLGVWPNFTTTLGREGSDGTAAIFAYCLNAESVTIWKDVPGVMNADPRYFENASWNQISYREVIELAFYGATVIHPKRYNFTEKEIPLFVKSFINPLLKELVFQKEWIWALFTLFYCKRNQLLISCLSL
jgi:aspartate kinase